MELPALEPGFKVNREMRSPGISQQLELEDTGKDTRNPNFFAPAGFVSLTN